MTKVRRPYSRVYWEALDDPKFATVWDDDRALAAWLRLLVAADMAWPASASLYHGVNRAALAKLCEVRLVDMQAAGRYRIHGLDKERAARARQASDAAAARWDDDEPPHPAGNADGMRPHPPSNPQRMPSQDEPSRDEQRRDEQSTGTERAPDAEFANATPPEAHALRDLADELTGRHNSLPNVWGGLGQMAVECARKHGIAAVEREWRRIAAAERGMPTLRQLVLGADNALNTVATTKPMTDEQRKEAEIAAYVAEVNARAAAKAGKAA